ncbi:MAG: hypothetical protein HY904_20360 [Deltaproteobacteria bacterium]|nr:hypothetical protein [Deltaproteobacteria bacterium]
MPLFRRSDGTLARDVAPYRQIMPFIMRTRNESAVYFKQTFHLEKTLRFIEEWNARGGPRITLFHVFLHAAVHVLHRRPRLNRFVAGGRLYDRDGIWISYSAKKALNDASPIVVLKRRMDPAASFAQLVEAQQVDLKGGRSDEKSHVDRELGLILALPAFIIRLFIRLQFTLYDWNLLPDAFMRPDPMFASMFIANLGSLKMDSAYHHLYEYGNIGVFAVLGRVQHVVEPDHEGKPVMRPIAEARYTFDERVEDGLYGAQSMEILRQMVEDPEAHGYRPT